MVLANQSRVNKCTIARPNIELLFLALKMSALSSQDAPHHRGQNLISVSWFHWYWLEVLEMQA